MFEEEQNNIPPAELKGGRRGRKSRHAKSKKSQNGSKKTRKMAKGPSDWNKKVMMIYRELKKKDKNVKLGAAMKEASRRKKAGKL